jgi:hypothetical protein
MPGPFSPPTRLLTSPSRQGWRADERGAIAVEFALVAGFLFMVLLVSVSLYDAYRAGRRMDYTAGAIADLTTRMAFVTPDSIDDLFATGRILLEQAGPSADLDILIAGISNPVGNGIRGDGSGNPNDLALDWSFSTSSSLSITQSQLAGLTLPDIFDGEGVALVRIEGDYNVLFPVAGLQSSFNFTRQAVRRPRFSDRVLLETPN